MSIRKRLGLSLLLCTLHSVLAGAQGITIPNTFVNGTAADATQVNANFTSLANNALNRTGGTMTGTLTTVLVQPTVTNTSDIGTTSLLYRTGYVRTSLVLGQAAGNYTVTWANPAAARAISFEDPGGTDILVYKAATQTLTNKTLTAPVLSGSVTGTYTLGGTPTIPASGLTGTITSATQDLITRTGTITSGVWSAGAVTSSGAITAGTTLSVPSGQKIFVDGGGDTWINEAVANNIDFVAGGTSAFRVSATSLSIPTGNKLFLDVIGGSNTYLSETVADNIDFVAGGTTALRVAADGLHFGANLVDSTATPSLSTHFNTSGDSIAGKDYAFVVTTGNGIANSTGVVAFNVTYANVPACTASRSGGNGAGAVQWLEVLPSATSVTLSVVPTSATWNVGETISVLCRGF